MLLITAVGATAVVDDRADAVDRAVERLPRHRRVARPGVRVARAVNVTVVDQVGAGGTQSVCRQVLFLLIFKITNLTIRQPRLFTVEVQ